MCVCVCVCVCEREREEWLQVAENCKRRKNGDVFRGRSGPRRGCNAIDGMEWMEIYSRCVTRMSKLCRKRWLKYVAFMGKIRNAYEIVSWSRETIVLGNRRCYIGFQINLSKPTGHVMHQQFNIQQLSVLPTLYLCVLYLSENKQRLVPLTA